MGDMLTLKAATQKSKLGLLLLILLLAACSNNATSTATETLAPEEMDLSPTPEQPTPTPVPAAAAVNGEIISLAWFENEVSRYILAQESIGAPTEDEAEAQEIVLNDLIDQVLLAQGAREGGATVSDQDVQARIDTLAEEYDLNTWMAEWGYTEAELFNSLKLQMLAAIQRDWIAESISETSEQVKLQQIFTYTEADAQTALISLNSGTSFAELAFSYIYDPITGGHLGWVPRGYLLDPKVEEAAFSLPIGSYSEIIETEVGFHIILVLDREEHTLSNDALLTLQRKALYTWLDKRRENSTIEVSVD